MWSLPPTLPDEIQLRVSENDFIENMRLVTDRPDKMKTLKSQKLWRLREDRIPLKVARCRQRRLLGKPWHRWMNNACSDLRSLRVEAADRMVAGCRVVMGSKSQHSHRVSKWIKFSQVQYAYTTERNTCSLSCKIIN